MRSKILATIGCLSFALITLPSMTPVGLAQMPSPAINATKQTFDRQVLGVINQNDIVISVAQSQLREALAFYRAQSDVDGQNLVKLAQAYLAYRDGDYSNANFLLQAVPQDRQKSFYGHRMLLVGMLQINNSDYQLGLMTLNLAAGFVITDRAAETTRQLAIGEAERYIGRYNRAIQALASGQNSFSPVTRSQAIGLLADIYLDLGRYEKARDLYESAIAMQQGIPSFWGQRNFAKMTANHVNLGRTYRLLNQPAQAQKHYEAAQRSGQSFTDQTGNIFLLTQLGLTALESGRFEAAEQQLLQAVAQSRSYQQGRSRVTALQGLGRYYQVRQQWDLAIKTYREAVMVADRTAEALGQARALTNLGEVFVQTQRWDDAIATLTQAVDRYESLRPGLNDQDKVAIADSQAYAYQLLQAAQVAKGQPQAALITAERGRARAFVEQLAQRTAQSIDSRLVPPTTAPPNLADIQATARKQRATLVSYSVLRDPDSRVEKALYIWVISPQGEIQFRRVDLQQRSGLSIDKIVRTARNEAISDPEPSTQAATRLVVAMRGGVHGANRSGYTGSALPPSSPAVVASAARNAYALLIQPIADLLPSNPDDRVVFIPQGSLFVVPFYALQDDAGKYLIEKHTVQIAPSIQALQLVKSNANPTGKPLIVGNPRPMPENLTPLPGAELEANSIAKILKTTALVGVDATKTTVKSQIEAASLLHFATHGLVDDEWGTGSAIALVKEQKNDGLLTADEIFNFRLKANLAVLSACDTGRGRITGDGVIGLSRSLMSAGVPSVIVSLWAVPDVPTQSLMTHFYQNLQQQPDKAKALRQAMLTTMKQYPNPSDWAAFVLVGSAD